MGLSRVDRLLLLVRDAATEARENAIELAVTDHNKARRRYNDPTDAYQRQGDPHRLSALNPEPSILGRDDNIETGHDFFSSISLRMNSTNGFSVRQIARVVTASHCLVTPLQYALCLCA